MVYIQQIASNIAQQAQATEQISGTAQSISKGIEQNSSGAKTLADAVDQQKVVIAVIGKSLEEVELLLTESRALVGLRSQLTEEEEREDKTDLASQARQESQSGPASSNPEDGKAK